MRFFRHFKKILLFLFVAAFLFAPLFYVRKNYSVSYIEIVGTTSLRGVSSLYGVLLFFVSPRDIEKALFKSNPYAKKITVSKIYPYTLRIEVEKGRILALLEVQDGYFYLGESGRILQKKRNKESAAPLIRYYQKLPFAEFQSNEVIGYGDILATVFFLQKCSDIGIAVDTVDIVSPDMLVFKKEEKTYYFSTNRDKEAQFNDLKTIIERFSIEAVAYESIDVRFKRPIVKLIK
ncbi:MAG TPA: hypothetical protein VJH96_01415 [Patescibacteria group bacterium]|nr:hypothetical protein [Patescibacteria group bacterium]